MARFVARSVSEDAGVWPISVEHNLGAISPEMAHVTTKDAIDELDDLWQLISEERRAYARLLDVLTQEQHALRRMDRLTLQKLNDSKERIFGEIAGYERDWISRLKTITGVACPYEALALFLHPSQSTNPSLQTLVAELMSVAARVNELLDQNRKLTSYGLNLIRGILLVVTEHCGGQIYSMGGQRSSTPTGLAVNVRG